MKLGTKNLGDDKDRTPHGLPSWLNGALSLAVTHHHIDPRVVIED